MKKIKIILGLLIFALFFSLSTLSAQPGPPPDDGTGGDPIGGGGGGSAPLGAGTLILSGLALAYGGKKLYELNRHKD